MNLYDETEQALKNHRLGWRNIVFIMNKEGVVPIAEFCSQAKNLNYDDGFGLIMVDPSLRIVGKTWWMTRESYDGSEGWVYHKKPNMPTLPAVDFDIRNHEGTIDNNIDKKFEK